MRSLLLVLPLLLSCAEVSPEAAAVMDRKCPDTVSPGDNNILANWLCWRSIQLHVQRKTGLPTTLYPSAIDPETWKQLVEKWPGLRDKLPPPDPNAKKCPKPHPLAPDEGSWTPYADDCTDVDMSKVRGKHCMQRVCMWHCKDCGTSSECNDGPPRGDCSEAYFMRRPDCR